MLHVNQLTRHPVWAAGSPLQLIGAYLLLITLLIFGGVAIAWAVRRYRRPPDEKLTPEEHLDQFRALQEQGELSVEELERIRALLEQGPAAPAQTPRPPDRPGPSGPRAAGGDAPVRWSDGGDGSSPG
jgi:hypothetical protein